MSTASPSPHTHTPTPRLQAWDKAKLLALLSSSTPAPLRVHFHFEGLTDEGSINAEQAAALTGTLAPAVTAIVQRFVKARVPESAPLRAPWFDEDACSVDDGYLIPEQMKSDGASAVRGPALVGRWPCHTCSCWTNLRRHSQHRPGAGRALDLRVLRGGHAGVRDRLRPQPCDAAPNSR